MLLNINIPKKVKKQKTLSNKGVKSKNYKTLKKSTTRTSKWNMTNNSPNRSKTIERKFTLSSSISSIRCLSKKRENQQASGLGRCRFVIKHLKTNSTTRDKSIDKRRRFNALNLNLKNTKKQASVPINHARSRTNIAQIPRKKTKKENKKVELDPSIERSLNQVQAYSEFLQNQDPAKR